MGFRQEKLLELGLDVWDATILRYFIDFKETNGMKVRIIDGKAYYWIRYDGVLKGLPVLNMKKGTIQCRFYKLRDAGVLSHQVVREGGTYSFFGIGEKYEELVNGNRTLDSDSCKEKNSQGKEDEEENIEGCFDKGNGHEDNNNLKAMDENLQGADEDVKDMNNKSQGVDENIKGVNKSLQGVNKNPLGYGLESTTNNSSIKDSSIINNINTLSLKEQVVEIIEYLNLKTDQKFKSTTKATIKLIKGRLKEGFEVEDFKAVIDNMVAKWTGTEYQQYLVPTTLFGHKFETYLNTRKVVVEPYGLKRGNVVPSDRTSKEALEEKLNNMVLREDM